MSSGLSRRALFGAGLREVVGGRFDREAPAPRAPSPRPTFDHQAVGLGDRLAPVAHWMVDRAGAPCRLAVVAGADGAVLADAAAVAGHDVVVLAPGTGHPAEPFAAVLGWFGLALWAPRVGAQELLSLAAPGATLLLAAWPGSPWSRYETAYRHFFDLPDLDVVEVAAGDGLQAVVVVARQP